MQHQDGIDDDDNADADSDVNLSSPYNEETYDFPSPTTETNSNAFDNNENVNLADSKIDEQEIASFYGYQSVEYKQCFNELPADNGYLYQPPGENDGTIYGPLQLEDIVSVQASEVLAPHSDDHFVLCQNEQSLHIHIKARMLYDHKSTDRQTGLET